MHDDVIPIFYIIAIRTTRIIFMNFSYGPPQPAPNGANSNNNFDKDTSIESDFSHNQFPSDNRSQSHINQPSSANFLNLPTHLPNEGVDIPTPIHIEEVPVEEPKAQTSAPVYIPGTTITLQTEEDIAKWIAERKKKWPTKANIEKKQQSKIVETIDRKRKNDDTTKPDNKKRRTVCKFFKQNRKCRFGTECKNLHELNPAPPANTKFHYTKTINNIPVLIPKLYANRQDTALFKNLVQRDQSEHENSTILDFIQFLDQKGIIRHDITK